MELTYPSQRPQNPSLSPYFLLIKPIGDDNKGNDHQKQDILILMHILPTSTIKNVWRTVRKKCKLIIGLKWWKYNFLYSFSKYLQTICRRISFTAFSLTMHILSTILFKNYAIKQIIKRFLVFHFFQRNVITSFG